VKLLSWARLSGADRRLARPATDTSDHRARQLLAILADPAAPEGDKYDAAMDLEFSPGPLVEPSLVRSIRDEGHSSVLAQVCAESLAGIWAREDRIDPEFFGELTGPARDEVIGILSARAPHLIPFEA
jgi:hypothetical protein